MFDRSEFEKNRFRNAEAMSKDAALQELARDFMTVADRHHYAYQWTWLGLPIIQLPPDIMATQEIIWQTKPDVIIETGVAWGGSILLYASLLRLIGKGKVIGIDLNLVDHVKDQIMSYDFSSQIQLYKGSSTAPEIIEQVKGQIGSGKSVMVLLDSHHTHDHVRDELTLYAPLVTKGQYLVVCDTHVEDFPMPHRPSRAWGKGNNPMTAMREYLKATDRFELDTYIDRKLLTTFTPNGYLRCVK